MTNISNISKMVKELNELKELRDGMANHYIKTVLNSYIQRMESLLVELIQQENREADGIEDTTLTLRMESTGGSYVIISDKAGETTANKELVNDDEVVIQIGSWSSTWNDEDLAKFIDKLLRTREYLQSKPGLPL